MQDTITTTCCLCDDFRKANGYCDDPQCRFATAQVMTTPLVAATFFGGNLALTRRFLVVHGYFRHDLSASRFCRCLHAIAQDLWHHLFRLLGAIFVHRQGAGSYVVDLCPVLVCDNIRIQRCKLLSGEAHRGFLASKRVISLVSRCIC